MPEDIQQEVERLRNEVESYRQRELDGLRASLAAALAERDHYKTEAYRNASVGQQISAELQAEIARLRSQMDTKEQVTRHLRTNANAARN